jgi:hypothetical protein
LQQELFIKIKGSKCEICVATKKIGIFLETERYLNYLKTMRVNEFK